MPKDNQTPRLSPRLRALKPMLHERLIERRVVSAREVYLEGVYLQAICPPMCHTGPYQQRYDFAEVMVPDEDATFLTGTQDWLFLSPQNRLRDEAGKVYDDIRALYSVLLMDGAFRYFGTMSGFEDSDFAFEDLVDGEGD